jgi:enoyl-CoA hydratase
MADVEIERPEAGLAVVRLNRPERLNALSWDLTTALHEALDELDADNDLRAIVLTGTGRGFCSGLDLGDAGRGSNRGKGTRGARASMRSQKDVAGLPLQLRALTVPVIAAVNGPAYGGGFALALASDLRVASTSAVFCTQFIKLGLSGCDVGVSYLLPKLIGGAKAHELMLTARKVAADEALALGLVMDVVPDGEVVDRALDVARQVTAFTPFATEMTKEVMWANLDAPSLAHAIHLENRTQTLALGGERLPSDPSKIKT